MSINWNSKLTVLVITLVVLVGVVVYMQMVGLLQLSGPSAPYPVEQTGMQKLGSVERPEVKLTPAVPLASSGNVDNIVNALNQEAVGDQQIINVEAGDTGLLQNDSQAINEFGQSYGETQF